MELCSYSRSPFLYVGSFSWRLAVWRSGRLKVERTELNHNQIPIPSVHRSFIVSTEPLRLLYEYKQLIWKGPDHVSRMKGGP